MIYFLYTVTAGCVRCFRFCVGARPFRTRSPGRSVSTLTPSSQLSLARVTDTYVLYEHKCWYVYVDQSIVDIWEMSCVENFFGKYRCVAKPARSSPVTPPLIRSCSRVLSLLLRSGGVSGRWSPRVLAVLAALSDEAMRHGHRSDSDSDTGSGDGYGGSDTGTDNSYRCVYLLPSNFLRLIL